MRGMLRIHFDTEQDCIKGNYVLITNTLSRRLRGDIFEIAEEDQKLLDDHKLHYTILPVGPNETDQEIRIPLTYEIPRRNSN